MKRTVDVLMIGTGEYTTGYVHGSASDSDKSAGVVALTMFDLRSRGLVGRLGLCGVNGTKFPAIRGHLQRAIGDVYSGLDLQLETFPSDSSTDPAAYLTALDSFQPGDAVTIFTPDDTHFDIALAAVERGLHVLVTKPVVKTLEQHRRLHEAAQRKGVLVAVEVHKRWDPMYADARDKLRELGSFSFLQAYMSQPKHQLHTFKSWAGAASDISYYLNSHHIDFHEWVVGERGRPVQVTASAARGVASSAPFDMDAEDTITLLVDWENFDGSKGTAIYTSSWIAPRSDVHSQQRFFYMAQAGEIAIDQAHRGYTMASDSSSGLRSVNPLFMKYTPGDGRRFAGQLGYGYRSFEAFVAAVAAISAGQAQPEDFAHSLASIGMTYRTTAVLEAGRRSLDERRPIRIEYADPEQPTLPTSLT